MGLELDPKKGTRGWTPNPYISTNPLCNILPHKAPPPPRDPSIRMQMRLQIVLKSRKFEVFSFNMLEFTGLTFNAFQRLKLKV